MNDKIEIQQKERGRSVALLSALVDEVMTWKTVQGGIFVASKDGTTTQGHQLTFRTENLAVRHPEELPQSSEGHFYYSFTVSVLGGLGWLSPEQINAEGDRWAFHFPTEKLGSDLSLPVWVESDLPRAWDGNLQSWLVNEEVGGNYLVGKATKKGVERYWLEPGLASEMPALPKLGAGEARTVEAQAMQFLGVLWRLEQGRESWPTHGGLHLAWGDRKGKFLGWEKISNMGLIGEIAPESVRRLESLSEWEELEKQLRSMSWGRGL